MSSKQTANSLTLSVSVRDENRISVKQQQIFISLASQLS